MQKSKTEIAEIIVAHLLDIEAGQCAITDEAIAREEDRSLQEILTGLMYLHEDLILKEDQRKKSEEDLKRVYEELQEKSKYLERFNRLMVNRELEMIRLKAEINDLLKKSGQAKKYMTPG